MPSSNIGFTTTAVPSALSPIEDLQQQQPLGRHPLGVEYFFASASNARLPEVGTASSRGANTQRSRQNNLSQTSGSDYQRRIASGIVSHRREYEQDSDSDGRSAAVATHGSERDEDSQDEEGSEEGASDGEESDENQRRTNYGGRLRG